MPRSNEIVNIPRHFSHTWATGQEREMDRKGTAMSRSRVYQDRALIDLDNLIGDRQPQACAKFSSALAASER